MDRYKNTGITRDKRNNKVYKTTIYPKINPSPSDLIIRAKQGDRLDMLAHRFYGDVTLWWVIAQANNLRNGSLYVDPGKKLRIPKDLAKIFNDLKKLQQSR